MSIVLPDHQEWIDRIQQKLMKDEQILKKVDGVVDFAAAQGETRITPAVWVIPNHESGNGKPLGQGQNLLTVTIAIAVQNHRDRTGKYGHAELMRIRQKLLNALLGWTPPNCFQEAIFLKGQMLSFDQSTIWYADEYQTSYLLR